MTNEEKVELAIRREREQLSAALDALCHAIQLAGVPLKALEIVDTEYGDRFVEATFSWGVREANITADSAPTALWDVMKQIPELRSR